MHGRPVLRGVLAGAVSALTFLALALSTQAQAAPAVTWQVDLSQAGSQSTQVRYLDGALRLSSTAAGPASLSDSKAAGNDGYGALVLPSHDLDQAVNRVQAHIAARTPSGSRVQVDVRGLDREGEWTGWRRSPRTSAVVLPRPVVRVQARLTLWSGGQGGGLAVTGVGFTADSVPQAAREDTRAAFSARVFATREGLVGGLTANGHVIQPNDHFVALPSTRGLSPRGSTEFSVEVCGPASCETAPVWDVGPWNIRDDYWNPPSARERFQDLPQGLPEAQAAFQDGYSSGLDGFGRKVLNPAGIDLADGTFDAVGLQDNGFVTVTFLWT